MVQTPNTKAFYNDQALRGNILLSLPQSKALLNRMAMQILKANQIDQPVYVHIVEGEYYGVNSSGRGNIAVNLETLKKAQSPDEIAFLLAHELALMQNEDRKKLNLVNAFLMGAIPPIVMFCKGVTTVLGLSAVFTGIQLIGLNRRKTESQEDRAAVQLLCQAGYNSSGFRTAFATMKTEEEQLPMWIKSLYGLLGMPSSKIEKRQQNMANSVTGQPPVYAMQTPMDAYEWAQLKNEAFSNPQRLLPSKKA